MTAASTREVYSGWAFGMGLGAPCDAAASRSSDLRLIFENDVRFLEQF